MLSVDTNVDGFTPSGTSNAQSVDNSLRDFRLQ
jgi:hypothetical protein